MCMKIKKQKNKAVLSISKREWVKIGQDAGWPIPKDVMGQQEATAEPFQIEVKRYGNRTWAVYLNGELVCVTVYKKGAFAVESILGELWQRIQDAEGKVRMVG